jgi:hypothetical protein
MSPFAVAQSTSVIQGKLMFEGKLVSAALNASGILANRMRYDFDGEGATRAVTATATIVGETEPRAIRITLAEAKTTNGMWTKQPDQQLVYFSTRAWARRHAPEVMLGVYSPEEMDEAPPAPTFSGTTIDARVETSSAGDAIGHKFPDAANAVPRRPSVAEWLDGLATRLRAAETADAVDAIIAEPKTQQAQDTFSNGARERLVRVINEALERTRPEEFAPIENDPQHTPA